MFGNDSSKYASKAAGASKNAAGLINMLFSPYSKNGPTDFNNARSQMYSMANALKQFGNPNFDFYKYLDESPENLLDQAMSGYSQSPLEQSEQKAITSGAENAELAGGTFDSGQGNLENAEIDNVLTESDMNDWLSSLFKTSQFQEGILGDYNKNRSSLADYFQDMLKTQFGARQDQASAIGRAGQQVSDSYNREGYDKSRSGMRGVGRGGLIGEIGGITTRHLLNHLFDGFGSATGAEGLSHLMGDAGKTAGIAAML